MTYHLYKLNMKIMLCHLQVTFSIFGQWQLWVYKMCCPCCSAVCLKPARASMLSLVTYVHIRIENVITRFIKSYNEMAWMLKNFLLELLTSFRDTIDLFPWYYWFFPLLYYWPFPLIFLTTLLDIINLFLIFFFTVVNWPYL